MKILNIRVSEELHQGLKDAAARRRLTVTDLVRPLIEKSLDELEGQIRLDLEPGGPPPGLAPGDGPPGSGPLD